MINLLTAEIDPLLWDYDDPRVTALFEGKDTFSDFAIKSTAVDPWSIYLNSKGWGVKVFTADFLVQETANRDERIKRGLPVPPGQKQPLPPRIVPLEGTPNIILRIPGDTRLADGIEDTEHRSPDVLRSDVRPNVTFVVDPSLWLLDDPRINRLHSGELSISEFIRSSDHKDPWSVVKDTESGKVTATLRALLPDGVIQQEVQYKLKMRRILAHTGGITGKDIYNNSQLFLTVFPELKDGIDAVSKQIAEENCSSCAVGKVAEPLADILLAIPLRDRDITALSQILPEQAMLRLRNNADLDEESVSTSYIPYEGPQIVPLRSTPLSGTPKWVMYHPTEVSGLLAEQKSTPGPRDQAPRPPCFDCCRKHLAKAVILLGESQLGYPVTHWWLAIGNMSEAEDEVVSRSPEIAEKIRNIRLAAMANGVFDPATRRYRGMMPNLLPIIEEVTDLAFIESAGGLRTNSVNTQDVFMQRGLPVEWPVGMHNYADLYYRLPRREGAIHGIRHAVSVTARGAELALAQGFSYRDAEIVRLFGLFHDCGRLTDGPDPDHGLRAAEQVRLFRVMLVQLDDEAIELLYTACLRHNLGEMSDNVIIQTCWDADRMDLPRVGVQVNPELLGPVATALLSAEQSS